MKRSLLLGVFGVLVCAWAAMGAEAKITAVKQPDGALGYKHYPGNRAPLLPSPLVKLPVGAVRPEGWVKTQLELEAEGFTGHLDQVSGFLQPEGNAWLSPKGEGDRSFWEELPYWLKGYGDLGYLLENERITREAKRWIEPAIASQREDGYFGPRRNLTNIAERGGKPDVWPNMIMLDALQSYYEYSGDERVPKLMAAYFRWELAVPEEDFLLPFWQQQRASDNLASVYWLYNCTGEPWLLDLAAKIHRRTANWTEGVASWHGVNIAQCFREPGIFYPQGKDPKFLKAAYRNYDEVRRLYGQVPGGMYGADENCRPGYSDPRQATETCSFVEMMLSCERLLAVSGDTLWADRCEDVAFNSLPASMTADLKALRYLTAPNMVLSDRFNKSPGLQNGGPMLLYDPHMHRCCQHNVSHGWPYFVEHLWMAAPGDGLAAVLYAPCRVQAKVGDGTEVTVTEKTTYPFDETSELAFSASKPVAFPLYLRVPGWCEGPKVKLNGQDLPAQAAPGSYLVIERTWADGDTLSLALPMKVAVTRWAANKNSASIERGPLTYSLKIGEKCVRVGNDEKWPAWEIHPTTDWNYGLVLNDADPAAGIEVAPKSWSGEGQPFTVEAAPVELRAKARKIPAWKKDALGLVGLLQPSPVKSDQPEETVTLIPMGCARLRIASFPVIGQGADAHEWSDPPVPQHTASHCFENDTVTAMSDGLVPRDSNDHRIPRFTWWPERGTEQWVTYDFSKPRSVSAVEVYWFDDTGLGQCRVPKSCRVEWWDGKAWQPVSSPACGVDRDKFNQAAFEPVTTTRLRLTVQLQPEFSGGILEWRVK